MHMVCVPNLLAVSLHVCDGQSVKTRLYSTMCCKQIRHVDNLVQCFSTFSLKQSLLQVATVLMLTEPRAIIYVSVLLHKHGP